LNARENAHCPFFSRPEGFPLGIDYDHLGYSVFLHAQEHTLKPFGSSQEKIFHLCAQAVIMDRDFALSSRTKRFKDLIKKILRRIYKDRLVSLAG
jgi:hypothetical protein